MISLEQAELVEWVRGADESDKPAAADMLRVAGAIARGIYLRGNLVELDGYAVDLGRQPTFRLARVMAAYETDRDKALTIEPEQIAYIPREVDGGDKQRTLWIPTHAQRALVRTKGNESDYALIARHDGSIGWVAPLGSENEFKLEAESGELYELGHASLGFIALHSARALLALTDHLLIGEAVVALDRVALDEADAEIALMAVADAVTQLERTPNPGDYAC